MTVPADLVGLGSPGERARAERVAQGLPPLVTDGMVLGRVARRVRAAQDAADAAVVMPSASDGGVS